MTTAREIMTSDVLTVTPDTEISKATKLLLDRRINGLPVVGGGGKLIGILCQSDLISQQKKLSLPSFFTFLDGFIPMTSMKDMEKEIERVSATKVEQIMTADPITVGPDADLQEVATLMVEKGFHTVPVVDDGILVGVVGKADVLRTIISEGDEG